MKKQSNWIFVIIALVVAIAVIGFFVFRNNNFSSPQTSPSSERTGAEINVQTNNNFQNDNIGNEIEPKKKIVEKEISKFSTDIQIDDDNRDNNLELTASKINETVVKKGDEFSFNKVAGNPTPERGYEKAGVFVNGQKVKGYGGGNCQISTTLYDAVLKVKGLKVTERHEHGKEVGYVEMGKDATVVYDELDLKFKNETENDIKIYANVTKDKVNVKIVKLVEE